MISAILLFGKYIGRLGLAHKILDTFEKMDAINPTFELIGQFSHKTNNRGHIVKGPTIWSPIFQL